MQQNKLRSSKTQQHYEMLKNRRLCPLTLVATLRHKQKEIERKPFRFFFFTKKLFSLCGGSQKRQVIAGWSFFCRKQTETGFRGQIGTIIWTPGMWEKETGCQKTDVVAMARWRSLSSVQIHLCLWATIWRGINLACMRRSLWGYSVFKTCLSVLGFFIY